MSRITKPVEIRRQEIIDTARKLFIENGFDKTAISDIVKTLNVAQGLVYHYFKSKTDLLYAVIDDILKEEAIIKEKIVSEHPGKAKDCLRELFSVENPELKKQLYGELFVSLAANQAIMEYADKIMSTATEPFIVTLIERGNQDGSWNCEHPKETASFILYGIRGIINDSEPITGSIVSRVLGINE